MKRKIYFMGHHLGLSFSENHCNFKKGEPVEIWILKDKKQESFITHFNRIIHIRKEICKTLNLNQGDVIEVKLEKPLNLKRENCLFKNNQFDMLALIHSKTNNGNIIFIKRFIKQNEEWLNVWTYRSRKSLRLKRFMDCAPVIGQ